MKREEEEKNRYRNKMNRQGGGEKEEFDNQQVTDSRSESHRFFPRLAPRGLRREREREREREVY
jgi:hypothetical protein